MKTVSPILFYSRLYKLFLCIVACNWKLRNWQACKAYSARTQLLILLSRLREWQTGFFSKNHNQTASEITEREQKLKIWAHVQGLALEPGTFALCWNQLTSFFLFNPFFLFFVYFSFFVIVGGDHDTSHQGQKQRTTGKIGSTESGEPLDPFFFYFSLMD